jgi:hypothetical protein
VGNRYFFYPYYLCADTPFHLIIFFFITKRYKISKTHGTMMSSLDKNTERPNDELTTIQHQINRTTNESLESTRRMVDLAAQSHETGINTITMLSEQGEKLDRIEVSFAYNIIYSMKNMLDRCG